MPAIANYSQTKIYCFALGVRHLFIQRVLVVCTTEYSESANLHTVQLLDCSSEPVENYIYSQGSNSTCYRRGNVVIMQDLIMNTLQSL